MKYSLFLGCNIQARVPEYGTSSREILKQLGVNFIDVKEFGCCGYPVRNVSFKSFLLAAARNIAIAENQGTDLLVLCKCCFGSLKEAANVLAESPRLLSEINEVLGKEGLKYSGKTEIKHFLSVLFHEVGLDSIGQKIKNRYEDTYVAVHYGCHALRPYKVTRFDSPRNPTLFDKLVEATGAVSVKWKTKTDCCGAPLLGIRDELSLKLTMTKIEDSREAGASSICVACPYCYLQFKTVQERVVEKRSRLPIILYSQLLGLALGLDEETLGFEGESPVRMQVVSPVLKIVPGGQLNPVA